MRALRTLTLNEFILASSRTSNSIYVVIQLAPVSVGCPKRTLDTVLSKIDTYLRNNLHHRGICADIHKTMRSIVMFDDLASAERAMVDLKDMLSGKHDLGLKATLYSRGTVLQVMQECGSLTLH